jgi:hypothetical protein
MIEKGWCVQEFEEKFIKPIVSASYPATLAALSLTVLKVTDLGGAVPPFSLRITLLLGSTTFLLSAFSVFFYRIYPTRRRLWSSAAVTYLCGLFCIIISVLILLIRTLSGGNL